MGLAWPWSVSDSERRIAKQLRIRLRDGESELLLDVLLGGGCRVRVTIEFGCLVTFPFDTCRRDDAERTRVPRGLVVHDCRVRPVLSKFERVGWPGAKEELIEHGSPFPMWVDGHGQKDDPALDEFAD